MEDSFRDVDASRALLESLNFCVIDLETTGGHHERDRIIEIGMVKVSGLKIQEQINILVDPEIPIPEFIQRLTSIGPKDVKGMPKIQEVIPKIKEFIQDDILVAHNTSFDIPFLNAVFINNGEEKLENKVICTNVMTKHLIPHITNSNLSYMSELFELKHNQAHRALDDALASAQLLLKFCDIFIEKGIRKVNQLYYPRNKFELDRAHFTKDQLAQVKELLPQIKTSFDLTFKGKKGIIQGIIPCENLEENKEIINNYLENFDWEILTIRLAHPFLQSLLYFGVHFQKFTKEVQTELMAHLQAKFPPQSEATKFEAYDFILGHHLVQDQIIAYSFLGLSINAKNIFKVPAQQKKLYQYLLTHLNRFTSRNKSIKQNYIPEAVRPVVEAYLQLRKNKYLLLQQKDIKEGRAFFLRQLESFLKDTENKSSFPGFHL